MGSLFDLDGRTALVTGGGRGIGRMAAHGLLTAGARVIIASRKLEDCESTARELTPLGEIEAVQADLSTAEGCRGLAEAVAERCQSLDLLLNNAGATWGAPFAEFPASAWDKILDLNLKAPFLLTQELLPLLRAAARPGAPARVINIGSIDGLRVPALPNYSYSAAKAGLHHLTRTMAVELGPDITVNAIAPGPFASKMMAGVLAEGQEAFEEVAPLGRIGQDDDIAGAVVYLASAASAYVTGAVLPVDGGISIAPTV